MDFKEFNIEKNINSLDDISLNILKRVNKKNKKIFDENNNKNITILDFNEKYFGNIIIIILTKMDCRNLKELY